MKTRLRDLSASAWGRILLALLRDLNTSLLAVLVTLKLTSIVSWSWWWVLAPAWIPGVAVLILLLQLCWAHAHRDP